MMKTSRARYTLELKLEAVRLVKGLRVIDAGVMPLITTGNTNSRALMIAEMAAEWVQADV